MRASEALAAASGPAEQPAMTSAAMAFRMRGEDFFTMVSGFVHYGTCVPVTQEWVRRINRSPVDG
jgi:hypothetical protein